MLFAFLVNAGITQIAIHYRPKQNELLTICGVVKNINLYDTL